MRSLCIVSLLVFSSANARLSKFPRFQFGFGRAKGSTTSSQDEEYDYYEDDLEHESKAPISGITLAKITGIGACASIAGCGVLYKFGIINAPRLSSWFHRTSSMHSQATAQDDEESMNEEIENIVRSKSKQKNEVETDNQSMNGSQEHESPAEEEEEDTMHEKGIAAVLGSTLLKVSSNGTRLYSVNTTEALRGKTIGLYFSNLKVEKEMKDRNITRLMLANHVEMVRQVSVNNGKPLEMVYVSLDNNARSFRDMVRALKSNTSNLDTGSSNESNVDGGWLAIPYSQRSLITNLSEKFIPAEGPPQIVIVDADHGDILNRGALSHLLANPTNFPWKSPQPLDVLFGTPQDPCLLIDPQDTVRTVAEATNQSKYIGLYFTADWCAPCKTFLPLLTKTYSAVNRHEKRMEVIYVSLDRSESNFTRFRKQMPWPSLLFEGRKRAELEQTLGVRTLPTLIVIDKETGEIVTREGRGAVLEDPRGLRFPWYDNALTVLSPPVSVPNQQALGEEGEFQDDLPTPTSDIQAPPKGLVDGLALVVFTDKTTDLKTKLDTETGVRALATQYLKSVAVNANSLFSSPHTTESALSLSSVSQFRISFFLANGPSPILDAVRVLVGDVNVGEDSTDKSVGDALFGELKASQSKKTSVSPYAMVLDIPNRRFFKCEASNELNEEVLIAFVHGVFTGKVAPQPLAVNLDGSRKEG